MPICEKDNLEEIFPESSFHGESKDKDEVKEVAVGLDLKPCEGNDSN
jgi:hypothetical protein